MTEGQSLFEVISSETNDYERGNKNYIPKQTDEGLYQPCKEWDPAMDSKYQDNSEQTHVD